MQILWPALTWLCLLLPASCLIPAKQQEKMGAVFLAPPPPKKTGQASLCLTFQGWEELTPEIVYRQRNISCVDSEIKMFRAVVQGSPGSTMWQKRVKADSDEEPDHAGVLKVSVT